MCPSCILGVVPLHYGDNYLCIPFGFVLFRPGPSVLIREALSLQRLFVHISMQLGQYDCNVLIREVSLFQR